MLARIAESLFWIGRYIERADGTARILDVHLQLLLEDPWIDESSACRSLLAVMGSEAEESEQLTRLDVLERLATDRQNPSSIAYALEAARANARQAREIVSTELWECMNHTRARIPRRLGAEHVASFFAWVRERSALAVGIVVSAASRDDAWQFFTLGRAIERADVTARLLATRSPSDERGPSWTTILRSCGAYEVYLRSYRAVPNARDATEFLLLDRLFPRSIMFNVTEARACIHELDPRVARAGIAGEAERELSSVRAELELRPMEQILEDLPGTMERVQRAASATSNAVQRQYFPANAMPQWVGEAF